MTNSINLRISLMLSEADPRGQVTIAEGGLIN
jgi:hypothetical protein